MDLKFSHEEIKLNSYSNNVYPRGFKKLIRLLNNIAKNHGISAEERIFWNINKAFKSIQQL
jgi:hypothetical protein